MKTHQTRENEMNTKINGLLKEVKEQTITINNQQQDINSLGQTTIELNNQKVALEIQLSKYTQINEDQMKTMNN